MTLDEYQTQAARTAQPVTPLAIAISAMGLAGEAGEVVDMIKKQIGHGHTADLDKMRHELGDVLWYVADLASAYGLTLDDVARANVAKLRKRYPDGFSYVASRERAE